MSLASRPKQSLSPSQKISYFLAFVLTFSLAISGLNLSSNTAWAATPIPIGVQETKLALSSTHACAVSKSNVLRCWGNNDEGETNIPSDIGPVSQIGTGDGFTCALKTNSRVQCWGTNNVGQTTGPEQLGLAQNISTGSNFSCAIDSSSSTVCWGSNADGQLNVPSGLAPARFLSAGKAHVCALSYAGTVRCWGANQAGQISVPEDLKDVVQVSAGDFHTCSLNKRGKIACWGSNTHGELDVPVDLSPSAQVSAGSDHTCALSTTGNLRCWGGNSNDESTVGSGLGKLNAIRAGSSATCVVDSSSKVRCWGLNPDNMRDSPDFPPVKIKVTALVSGSTHSCALSEGHTLYCWGDTKPAGEIRDVEKVTAGGTNTCFITTLGTSTCSGPIHDFTPSAMKLGIGGHIATSQTYTCAKYEEAQFNGQSGCWSSIAYQNDILVPKPANLNGISKLSISRNAACAIKADGYLTCWGLDYAGLVNTGNYSGVKFSDLSGGGGFFCGLKLDGNQAECWGDNDFGQSSPPSQVSYTKISSGETHACAIRIDKRVDCWGDNSAGETAVPSDLANVEFISTGNKFSCAITYGGKTTCWGDNSSHQLDAPKFKISPPRLPHPLISNDGGQLKITVSNVFSSVNGPTAEDGLLTWTAFDDATGTFLCTSGSNSCTVRSPRLGKTYKVRVVAKNEAGSSLGGISNSLKLCPINPPGLSTVLSDSQPYSGKQTVIYGELQNFCPPVPANVMYREKRTGKGWSSWKAQRVSNLNTFRLAKRYDFPTELEYKVVSGTEVLADKHDYVAVKPGPFQLTMTSKQSLTPQGFTQGGVMTFQIKTSKTYIGTCAVEADTQYAFNFSLVLMGEEHKITTFPIRNGQGNGKIVMRWNGQVENTIACTSPDFPDDPFGAIRNVTFRANF